MLNTLAASELVLNPDGSVYHLNLQPEDIAEKILLVGDPDRVPKVSKYFEAKLVWESDEVSPKLLSDNSVSGEIETVKYLPQGYFETLTNEISTTAAFQKEIENVLHYWKEEGIKVEKARWGRSVITKGEIKIELSKDIDATKLTLETVKEMIEKKTPAKKTATKKAPAKKTVAKKK
jgi:hypothetical protein